jgi:hypothetical protein
LGQIRKNDPNLQGANPPWDKDSEFREEKYNGQIGGLGGMGDGILRSRYLLSIGPEEGNFSLNGFVRGFISEASFAALALIRKRKKTVISQ